MVVTPMCAELGEMLEQGIAIMRFVRVGWGLVSTVHSNSIRDTIVSLFDRGYLSFYVWGASFNLLIYQKL